MFFNKYFAWKLKKKRVSWLMCAKTTFFKHPVLSNHNFFHAKGSAWKINVNGLWNTTKHYAGEFIHENTNTKPSTSFSLTSELIINVKCAEGWDFEYKNFQVYWFCEGGKNGNNGTISTFLLFLCVDLYSFVEILTHSGSTTDTISCQVLEKSDHFVVVLNMYFSMSYVNIHFKVNLDYLPFLCTALLRCQCFLCSLWRMI
jgi:hypothetical protein